MKAFLFFVQFFIVYVAMAQTNSDSFNEKFAKAVSSLQRHKSFQISFKQEFFSILRHKVNVSEGQLSILTPQSFKFEIFKPRKELYVSNGRDFWKFVPDLNHAQHLRSDALEMNYLLLLTNPEHIKNKFNISLWKSSQANFKGAAPLALVQSADPPSQLGPELLPIKMEPKGDNAQKVLYAIINTKTGSVEEFRIVQLNGNKVRLVFSTLQERSFQPQYFTFIPPKGIAVDNN